MLTVSEYPMYTTASEMTANSINSYYLSYMTRANWDKYDRVINTVGGSIPPGHLYGFEMYYAGFQALPTLGLTANVPMTVMMQYTNDIILKGESFKVNLRNKTIYRRGANGTGGYGVSEYYLDDECTVNISKVFVGQNMASLQQVTASKGLYTAPVNVRYIVFLLSVGGRSVDFLDGIHGYMMLEKPSVIVYTPDPVTTQQTLDQTNSITSTVEEQTQQQTDTLMDTTGSDSIVTGVAGNATNQIEQISIVSIATNMSEQLKTAINTTEEDSSVVFPGISLMGFSIQSREVDVWEMMPTLKTPVRTMLTFVFCAAFVSHIIHLVQALLGIYEYGPGVEDWGNDNVSNGPKPKKWTSDYDIDEDLGF